MEKHLIVSASSDKIGHSNLLMHVYTRMVQVYLAYLLARRTRSLVVQHGGAADDRRAGRA